MRLIGFQKRLNGSASSRPRKTIGRALITLIALPCVATAHLHAANSDRNSVETKPNILFLFTDDQSYETIHHLGNEEIITPNMDRLARSGVSYSNAYNMGAWHGAVCVASRTSINTGRNVWAAKEAEDRLEALAEQGQFWSQLLAEAGYETYLTGKWHIQTEAEPLFDHARNVFPGMPEDTPEGYQRPKANDTWTPYDRSFGGFWEGGEHWSKVTANDAVSFLEQASVDQDPFFMYVAFNAPHDPRQSPKMFVDLYDREDIAIPESFMPEYPYKQEIGCYWLENPRRQQRDEKLAPWPRTEEAVQLHRQEYYAAITYLDEQIGRVLDALEQSGKAENTYIFFTSDHGLACGHHGLLGKQNMYEHSMKPPLIVSGPSLPKNETRDAFVYLQDIMPTTLELAGVAEPEYVDFHSLMPTLKSKQASSSYEAVYGSYRNLQRMIRVEDYKLIVYPEVGVYRLFNLRQDPEETRDLAPLGGKYEKIARRLFSDLVDLQSQMGDEMDFSGMFKRLKPASS